MSGDSDYGPFDILYPMALFFPTVQTPVSYADRGWSARPPAAINGGAPFFVHLPHPGIEIDLPHRHLCGDVTTGCRYRAECDSAAGTDRLNAVAGRQYNDILLEGCRAYSSLRRVNRADRKSTNARVFAGMKRVAMIA